MKKVITLVFLFFTFDATGTEVVSHRANICGLIENSVEAIDKAFSSKIKFVEIDVRVSKDGVVYLYHDDEILEREIEELDYEEVVSIVGRNRAPTLKQVFEQVRSGGTYILDLKSSWNHKQELLVKLVRNSGIKESKFIVQSHDLELLASFKRALPGSRAFYLSKLRRKFPFLRSPSAEEIISEIEGVNVDGISVKGRSFISKEFVDKLQDSGLDVFVWTINDADRFEYYSKIGVQGVITDRATEFSAMLNAENIHLVECG